jgi:phosphopantetheinyl transferase
MSVIVLHAEQPPGAAPPWQPALLQALPYARRLQLERRDAATRSNSLAGVALALFGAAQLRQGAAGIRELEFAVDAKPAFGRGPWFSVAHSGAFVCCALSLDVDPGLDVEACADAADVARRRQLQRWTAIEATLKAAGQGVLHAQAVELETDLAGARLAGVRYRLRPLELRPGLVCTLALPFERPVTMTAIDLTATAFSAALERSLGLGAQS